MKTYSTEWRVYCKENVFSQNPDALKCIVTYTSYSLAMSPVKVVVNQASHTNER